MVRKFEGIKPECSEKMVYSHMQGTLSWMFPGKSDLVIKNNVFNLS